MARKRKTTHRRRHLSAGPRKHSRRRSTRRRSRSLSSIFTPAGAMAAGKGILGGAAGGFAAGVGHKMMSGQHAAVRIGAAAVVSAVLYSVVGYPNVAAGFAGGVAALEGEAMTNKLMSEMGAGKYADASSLNTMPAPLSDNGVPMQLMEDGETGEMFYFDENTGAAVPVSSIYPSYATRG